MTAAAIVFYIMCICLGHARFEQLGRPYPALSSLGLFSGAFAFMLGMEAFFNWATR